MGQQINWKNQFAINWNDIKSVAMTAVIVGVSAAATSAAQSLGQLDWGPATPIVTVALATGLKLLDRWRRPTP